MKLKKNLHFNFTFDFKIVQSSGSHSYFISTEREFFLLYYNVNYELKTTIKTLGKIKITLFYVNLTFMNFYFLLEIFLR